MSTARVYKQQEIVKKRIGVTLFFFINGFLSANWAARLPEMQRFYEIDNTSLGILLFISATGALIAMPLSGLLSSRRGSNKVTQLTGLLFCFLVPILVLSKEFYFLSAIFFAYGACLGALNVSMNTQAVIVERLAQKPIMSSFHALFSIGMVLGAGSGALFSELSTPLFSHFLIVAFLSIMIIVRGCFHLVSVDQKSIQRKSKDHSSFWRKLLLILPYGIIAFCGMTGENTMVDWSAIYMNKVIGTTESISALAFGTYALTMTLGRIFGDYIIGLIGKSRMLKITGLFALTGMLLIVIPTFNLMPFLGFLLIGLGLANVAPITYSTAGNIKGIDSSSGVAMASTIGYTGFFVGPPMIGYLGDLYGLRISFMFTLILFVIMILFSLIFFKNHKSK